MRVFLFLVLLALLNESAEGNYRPDGKYLNVAILTLPPRYLADVPLEKRDALLLRLSSSPFEDRRLDYEQGWLHWYSDGPSGRNIGATSMFWLKLLRKENGKWLVFVHMAKPFAGNSGQPKENQTFVLERSGNEWKDITSQVIPEGIDLTRHFRPRRSADLIEVAPWEQFERQDGRGLAFRYGPRQLDLIWEKGAFRVANPEGPDLTKD